MNVPVTGRPAVSIVIPVWNAADVTRTCLRLLPATLAPGDEVIVVDNGSSDHTAEVLAEHSAAITTVVHEENLGFAAGCNAEAARATCPDHERPALRALIAELALDVPTASVAPAHREV